MNFSRYIFLFIIFIMSSSFTNQDVHNDPCSTVNSTFVGGEQVVYKIYYNWNFVWFSAGEVVFNITETDEHYIVEATGKTYKSYEIFFRVNDFYKTVIDKETMLPVEFERNIEEGGYRFYNRIEFNQSQGTAFSFSGKSKDEVVAQEFQIDECMHDMLSTVYFMRNMSFATMQKDDSFPVNMFIDDKVYPIQFTYEGQGKKSVKGIGDLDVFKICPEVVAGVVFTNGAKMNIWVTDDGNKVPVIIESPISVGSIQAILKSHTGLKHPIGQK